jgi:hypothetical protein
MQYWYRYQYQYQYQYQYRYRYRYRYLYTAVPKAVRRAPNAAGRRKLRSVMSPGLRAISRSGRRPAVQSIRGGSSVA